MKRLRECETAKQQKNGLRMRRVGYEKGLRLDEDHIEDQIE